MRYYLIAGEASGDLHASHLMQALKQRDEAAEFRFFGGDMMTAVGGTRVRHYRELAYMGFVPVLLHLRTILRNMKMCKRDIAEWHPDVVIRVDYPGFNLNIAQDVHSQRLKANSQRSITISRQRFGLGRSIASKISSVMLTNSSPSCLSRWISLKRNTTIPSIMWATLRLRKYVTFCLLTAKG